MGKVNRYTFDNGFRVITEQMSAASKAHLYVGVKVGSVNEDEMRNGGSHFNEHMAFKSNDFRDARQLIRDMEWNGIDTNAYTARDRTVYLAHSLPKRLPIAVDVLFQAVSNRSYRADEFELEREVILTEIRMGHDDHMGSLLEDTTAHLYANTPMQLPVAGRVESMSAIRKEELEAFKAEYHVPNNMALVCVGRFNEDRLLRQAEETFGRMERKDVSHPNLSGIDCVNRNERHVLPRDGIDLAYMTMTYKVPGIMADLEEAKKLDMLGNILSGGMSSRVFQKLRDEMGIGYSVGCSVNTQGNAGRIMFYIGGFDDSRFDEAVNAIHGIEDDLKRNLVGRKEMEGVRNYVLSGASEILKSQGYRAQMHISNEFGTIPRAYDLSAAKRYIRSVTREDVKEMAERYFTDDFLLVGYTPTKSAKVI